jgi:hypothetical protein
LHKTSDEKVLFEYVSKKFTSEFNDFWPFTGFLDSSKSKRKTEFSWLLDFTIFFRKKGSSGAPVFVVHH